MARGREAGARGWQRTGGEGDGTSAGGLVRFEVASSRTGAILATYANQVPYDLKNAESGRGDTGAVGQAVWVALWAWEDAGSLYHSTVECRRTLRLAAPRPTLRGSVRSDLIRAGDAERFMGLYCAR